LIEDDLENSSVVINIINGSHVFLMLANNSGNDNDL
jgi:hypothetical protein